MTYYSQVPVSRAATPRGRGRPPADAPALLRSDLLAAAAVAFAQGYAATSVRALARELGVSQAAVQHHASTKQDLLFAVIDEVVVPSLTATGEVVASLAHDADRSVQGSVRALVRSRVDGLVAHGGIVLSVMSDRSRGSDVRREHLVAALAPARTGALTALGALAGSGVIRPVSVAAWTALTTAAIPALAQAWFMLDRIEPGLDVDRSAVLDEITDLLVLGLLAR
jgi:AcrR family transcriptional regulator